MNKLILFLVFSMSLISLFLLNTSQLETTYGRITKIEYESFGIKIYIENQEFILLENKILDLSEGDSIKIVYIEKEYYSKPEMVVEKIIKI